jgi:tetratricopeptide (TPR) repeat protein/DNA-binding transcriptional regulator YdaS (Cro superfamily)
MDRRRSSGSSEDPFTSRLNELLSQLRALNPNRNQRWVARRMGIPESTLSDWRNGGIPGSAERVIAFADAIREGGVPVDATELLRLWQISRALRSRRPHASARVEDSVDQSLETGPASISKVPGIFRLPPDIAHFTGRKDILDELRALFEQETDQATAVIISAIAGKAGVGKTALAIHLAHAVKSRFPDGSLYVNLRGVDARPVDPAVVLANVLLAVGVAAPPIPDDLDARAGLYREWLAEHRILVVLDNAANEAQVRPLLPDTSSSAAIVTSRSRFGGLDSALVHNLDVLEPDQAVELLAMVSDRRLATAAEIRLAHDIVNLCGHLPLAVRIVGARLKSREYWDLQTVRDHLRNESRRLDELKLGDREVRASFALSYDERPEDEQRLFRLLGQLSGRTFTPWVAAALLDITVEEAEELVARLVDSTLLEPDGHDVNGHMRYRFHDLLRLFARERLDFHVGRFPDEDVRVPLRRVLAAYLSLAEKADALIQPDGIRYADNDEERGRRSVAWLRSDVIRPDDPIGWFAAERSCLVAAVEQAYETGFDDITWRLAAALTNFFSRRAHWHNWERTNSLGLQAARRGESRIGHAGALLNRGRLLIDQGRFGEAMSPLQESLQGFRGLDERRGESRAGLSLGNAYSEQGQWQDAIERFDECLPILQALGDAHTEAEALQSRALLYRYQGRWSEAVASIEDSLEIYRRLEDRLGKARALQRLGDVYRDRSDFNRAARFFESCLELCWEQRDHLGQARALRGLGITYRDRNSRAEARDCFERALEIIRGLRALDRHGEARVKASLSILLVKEGAFVRARDLAEECLIVYQEFDDRHGVADALHTMGTIALQLRPPEGAGEALVLLRDSYQTFRKIGNRLWQARAAETIGLAHDAMGNEQAAKLAWEEAFETFRDLEVPEDERLRRRLDRWR